MGKARSDSAERAANFVRDEQENSLREASDSSVLTARDAESLSDTWRAKKRDSARCVVSAAQVSRTIIEMFLWQAIWM